MLLLALCLHGAVPILYLRVCVFMLQTESLSRPSTRLHSRSRPDPGMDWLRRRNVVLDKTATHQPSRERFPAWRARTFPPVGPPQRVVAPSSLFRFPCSPSPMKYATMKHTIVAIILAATHCLLANASGLPSRTEKQDILSRLKARSPHKWFARQAQPLPSNAVCPADSQSSLPFLSTAHHAELALFAYTDRPTADDSCCPPDNVYNLNCAGVDYCCYGEQYGVGQCWSADLPSLVQFCIS